MPQPAESEKLESLPLPQKGQQAPSPAEEAVSQAEGLPPIESEGASSPAEAAGALPVPQKASEEPPAEPTPDVASQTEIRPGIASRLFRFLACCGPVAVLLFLAIELVPGIEVRGLLTGEEKTLLSVVQNFPGTTGLFVYANGAPEPSLYPLHIWFLKESTALLHGLLPALSPETLLHASSAIGLALMGIALWLLAFFTASGLLPAFASCAVFLGTLHIVQATHLATANGLFAALLFLSLLFLCTGWSRTRAPLALLAGHVLAVLAFLSGGVCGLGIPLLASLLFLFWRGAFRRAGGLDGVFAFGVMLVLSIGWLFWLSMDNNQAPAIKAFYDYHESMWYQNFLCRPEQIEPFAWRSLLYALPWLLVVLCLPWERLHHVPVMIWKNRTQNPSLGWVWCSLLATLTALTLCWPSTEVMLLPLAGLASILAARAVLHLSIRRSRLFFTLVGILMAVVSLPLLLAPVMPTIQQMLPERAKAAISFCFTNVLQLPGMFIMGAILLLFAVFLVAMTNKRFPTGGLLICLLFTAAMAQPFNLLTLPDLTARGILLPSCPLIVPTKPADTPKAPRVLKQPAQPAAQNPALPPAASPEAPINAPDDQAPEVSKPQEQSSIAPASTEGSTPASGAAQPQTVPPTCCEEDTGGSAGSTSPAADSSAANGQNSTSESATAPKPVSPPAQDGQNAASSSKAEHR